MRWRVVSVILLAFVLIGCRDQSAQQTSALPTVKMQLGAKTFTLEVAKTPEHQGRGLMRRDSMPADHGMIFVFAEPRELGFWMQNTRIPLDILYVSPERKVITIKQMKPYDETRVSSDGIAKWAIELNKGAAQDAGVKVGDVLEIPEEAREANP